MNDLWRMSRAVGSILVLTLCIGVRPGLAQSEKRYHTYEYDRVVVCLANVCVDADVANTRGKRQQGLMFRRRLFDEEGMLFVYRREQRYNFWMKNMNFPLDFIWIDKNMQVADYTENVQPCGRKYYKCKPFSPERRVRYVLEVNAGFVSAYGVTIGDDVSFLNPETMKPVKLYAYD